MGQLSFQDNIFYIPTGAVGQVTMGLNTLYFVPINVLDSISLKTLNLYFQAGWVSSSNNRSFSFLAGLYSLNASSLSLSNSVSSTWSQSIGADGGQQQYWISFTNTSATQNITPGTWYFGIVLSFNPSSTGFDTHLLRGHRGFSAENAFPGSFIWGRMTATTGALPSSYATSDLDTTGMDAMGVPYILLCS